MRPGGVRRAMNTKPAAMIVTDKVVRFGQGRYRTASEDRSTQTPIQPRAPMTKAPNRSANPIRRLSETKRDVAREAKSSFKRNPSPKDKSTQISPTQTEKSHRDMLRSLRVCDRLVATGRV